MFNINKMAPFRVVESVQLIALALVTIITPSHLEIWYIRILLLSTLSLQLLKPKYGLNLEKMIDAVL